MRAALVALTMGWACGGWAYGCTCGPEPSDRVGASAASASPAASSAGPPAAGEPEIEELAGGLAWHAGEPLLARRPTSPMRAAEYAVRGHPEAELTVFHFDRDQGGGGSVQDNVERWLGQFTQPDGRPSREVARIERIEVRGVPVTTLDVRGTFTGMRGGAAAGPPRPGWRMLGAIAEGRDGLVFFKLTGPEAAVEAAEGAFRALVESIRHAD